MERGTTVVRMVGRLPSQVRPDHQPAMPLVEQVTSISLFNPRSLAYMPEYENLASMKLRRPLNGLPVLLLGLGVLANQSGSALAAAPQILLSDQDVGPTGIAGSHTQSSGQMQIHGAGADIWYGADGFHFAYSPWDGDCQIVARVLSLDPTDPLAKAGVMVRADLTQRAPHALAALTAEYGLTFTRRAQPGGRSWDDAYVASDDRVRLWLDGHLLIDEWYEHREQASSALITLTKGQRYALRLDYFQERARAAAKLLWSNPSTPRQVIPQSQLYSDTPGAGLAGPGEDGAPSGVSLLPNPWQDQDVGLVGQAGSSSLSNGVWTVQGAGADVSANVDGLHLVYQNWSGDFHAVARLLTQQNTEPWARAGLMVRENLHSDCRSCVVAATPLNGVAFLRRDDPVATASQQPDTSSQAAQPWLKLVRRGSVVSAFSSTNGVDWSWIGTESVAMADPVCVGLAVNSHENSTLGAASFDNVSIGPPDAVSAGTAIQGTGTGLQAVFRSSSALRDLSILAADQRQQPTLRLAAAASIRIAGSDHSPPAPRPSPALHRGAWCDPSAPRLPAFLAVRNGQGQRCPALECRAAGGPGQQERPREMGGAVVHGRRGVSGPDTEDGL